MAARTYTDIFCDQCGNWEEGGGTRSVRRARAHVARTYRYRTIRFEGRTIDLCPECPTYTPDPDLDRINQVDWKTMQSVDIDEAFQRIRPEVAQHIEQIVEENADVWAERAKHE